MKRFAKTVAFALTLVMILTLGLTGCKPSEDNPDAGKESQITQYTVTFEPNGGSAVSAQKVDEGKKATEPTAPTKSRYRFDGWFKESALTTAWDFAADTVTGDVTLYAKWTLVEAGEITWSVPAAGSVVIPSDIGKYNKSYRLALEDFAPEVYASEDGERLPTIITDTDADFVYDEQTGLLTPGSYTVTYTAQNSINGTVETTFDVVVADAELSNYYVYVNKVGSAYMDTKWEEILGARIRVAADLYFVSSDGTMPAGLVNKVDNSLIADPDDAYLLKNASDVEMTVKLSDKSGVYAVFDAKGKVTYGVDGFQNKGVSAEYPFENSAKGYRQKDTIVIPAGSTLLGVGNSPTNGCWYYNADKTTWNPDAKAPSQFSSDGRAFVFNSVATRYGNMIQLKQGNTVLTGAYENQAPYMAGGFADKEFYVGAQQTAQQIKTEILKGIVFKDDAGTFEVADDVAVAAANISLSETDVAAIDTTKEGTFTVAVTCVDPSDAQLTSTYRLTVNVVKADKYLKIGEKMFINPTVVMNASSPATLPGDGKLYVYDASFAEEVPLANYAPYAVINKHTGKMIAAGDYSKIYDTDGTASNLAGGGVEIRNAFNKYLGTAVADREDYLLIVIVQPNHSTLGVALTALFKADHTNAYLEIKGLTGIADTVKPTME